MKDLSIIIVNYNTTDCLSECLNSILVNTINLDFEIIVVDNNSINRDIEKFPSIYPLVKFYFSKVNNGFGAGCNFAASKSEGEYLVILNPDTIIEDNVFLYLSEYMEKNPNTAMCSGLFLDFCGKIKHTYSNFPSIYSEFFEAVGIGTHSLLNRYLNSEAIKKTEPFKVDWITGACMFFNKKYFDEVKGFDIDYFLYFEDVDVQYRLHKLNYKIVCLPSISVKHSSNASVKSDDGENVYFFHIHKSRMIYFYKHSNFIKRNIIRYMHINGILFRISILYLRSSFVGKKKQKLVQYKRMLKIYFSNYESLLKLNY